MVMAALPSLDDPVDVFNDVFRTQELLVQHNRQQMVIDRYGIGNTIQYMYSLMIYRTYRNIYWMDVRLAWFGIPRLNV